MHLCVGTTPTLQRTMTFDRLTIEEVNRAIDVRLTASGKSINVARVLHILGERSFAVGFVGGQAGRMLQGELKISGIAHDLIEIASPTRTCITLIDRANKTATELVEEAGPVSPAELSRFMEIVRQQLARAKFLILSGSLAPGVPVDFYADCCQAAASMNVKTIVDARGQPLLLAIEQKPFLIKPNRAELSASVGMPVASQVDVIAAIRALMDGGAADWAVITMGSQGAIASDGKSFWRIGSAKIEAVSAVGSGDAFTAGLAAGIARGQTVPEACRLGAACGAANALIPGSGFLEAQDVQRLRSQIAVDRIS